MRVTVGAEHHTRCVIPRHGESCHVARTEILNGVMQTIGVISIVEVLHHDLPVPGKIFQRECSGAHRIFEFVVCKQRFVTRHGRTKRCGIKIEVDHNEALPQFNFQIGHTPLLLVEVFGLFHCWSTKQTSIEAIYPLVIRAGEGSTITRIFFDLHSAVLTN